MAQIVLAISAATGAFAVDSSHLRVTSHFLDIQGPRYAEQNSLLEAFALGGGFLVAAMPSLLAALHHSAPPSLCHANNKFSAD